MTSHPDPRRLQAHADGSLASDVRLRVDEHVLDCPRCRDDLRALNRIDRFLQGPRGREGSFDRDLIAEHLEALRMSSRRRRRRSARVLAAVALLVALLLWVPEAGDDTATVPPSSGIRASGWALPDDLNSVLRSLDPELSLEAEDVSYRELLRELLGEAEGAQARVGSSSWESVSLALAGLVNDRQRSVDDRLRAARAAAVLGARSVLPPLERLLVREMLPQPWRRHGLLTAARFGGSPAARLLIRVSKRRALHAPDLAEALIRCGVPWVAPRVRDLLESEGASLDDLAVQLNRLPGREAGRCLASLLLAGECSAALERVILERPGALAELRRRVPGLEEDVRVSVYRLLGIAGDKAAVPLLERELGNPDTEKAALSALRDLGCSGVKSAVAILVRRLPSRGEAGAFDFQPNAASLRSVFEGVPRRFEQLLESGARSERGLVMGSRWLVALGLTRSRRSLEFLVAQLAAGKRNAEAALWALALHGGPCPGEILRPYTLRSRAVGIRRAALAAAVRAGGKGRVALLLSAVEGSSDRRYLLREIARAGVPPWSAPVLEKAALYLPLGEDARRLLQRQRLPK